MSDVERATSAATGDESEQSARATTTTTTATTTTATAAAKAAAIKLQQQQHYHQQLYHHQQQQQQQQQYNNNKSTIATAHYCNNTSTPTLTPTSTADSASLTHPRHHHHHHHHHHHDHDHDHGHRHDHDQQQQQHQQQQQQQHSSSHPPLQATPATYIGDCVSQLLKIVFSTPGLVVLVVAYSVMGAFLFPLLEAPQDITKSEAIAKSREECLRELWIITEKLNVLYERNWTMLVHEQLRRFEGSIVAATRSNAVTGRGSVATTTTALGRFGGGLDAIDAARWTFSEALLYSVTVITTIGHGSLTPKTAAGKIATILYAVIGVPLMLMCLSSLGALLAEALQCTYARVCCRLNRHHGHHQQHRHHQNHRQHAHPPDPQSEKSGRIDGDERTDDGGRDMLKQPDQLNCQSKGHAINCKNCKYDDILGQTNLSNCYGYSGIGENVGGVADLSGERLEDSCQLLRNSPAKLNQNMTTAAAKAPTAAQYYQQRTESPQQLQQQQQQTPLQQHQQQQQQHQQQQQQQHPDVMLMATAQKLPQQQTFYSRSATPSPQHFQQLQLQHQQQHQQLSHPLQTFHIVSTASANSSPTHQQTMRQYATLQPQHHHHYQQQQLQQQQQQHFVAVPSSLVRFQATTNAGSASNCNGDDNGHSNTPPANCYQSAGVPATASATIYFPIAATNGPPTSAAAATTVAAAAAAAASQLLCNQPIVKYHTIQLQHSKKPFITAANAAAAAAASSGSDIGSATVPLPPPPAYQTATVHSVRRAKFLTKPLPPEINSLLAENDISCRHDLLQNTNVPTAAAASTPPSSAATATTTTAAAQLAANTLPASATTSPHALLSAGLAATTTAATTAPITATPATTTTTSVNTTCSSGGSAATPTIATAATAAAALGSSATVDIMEDEEEHEQQRLGNCPHGTPSRVPLISSSNAGAADYAAGAKESDKSTRGLINATAASFHRHTLHTFQRSAQRKSVHYGARRGCSAHATVGGILAHSRGGCYGDTAETSDDEEYMQRAASSGGAASTEQFKLKRLNGASSDADAKNASANAQNGEAEDADDADEDDDDCDGVYGGPQVPISVVLLILVCYICLGTVIFAFWENWSIVDGAYFCFVTLATIGYGDFVPERTFRGPQVQLFACCAYLLLGLVLVAMSFSILETQLMWKCKRIAVRLKLAKD